MLYVIDAHGIICKELEDQKFYIQPTNYYILSAQKQSCKEVQPNPEIDFIARITSTQYANFEGVIISLLSPSPQKDMALACYQRTKFFVYHSSIQSRIIKAKGLRDIIVNKLLLEAILVSTALSSL